MRSTFVRGRRWNTGAALAAVMTLVAAGCVGSTATGSAPVSSGASQIATPTAPAKSTVSPIDLSSVPLASSGTWKSIRWVQVAATPFIEATPSTDYTEFKIAGWSRGFVGFSLRTAGNLGAAGETTTTTSYSSDGVHWHAGVVLQQHPSTDNLDIRGVFEGPAGLVAVEESGGCGDTWVDGLLTSADGVTWQAVDMAKAFGKAVIWNVSGGSTGFVATDTAGHAVWTSRDGQNWQPVKLDTPAFATSRIDDGTAFSAGYVLVGSTELVGARSCATILPDPSASPSPTPPLRVPAVWWSADGSNWLKADLPGAKADYQIQMWVQRLDDHTLAVFDGPAAWVSNDGLTWKPLTWPVPLTPWNGIGAQGEVSFQTDGRRGVQIEGLIQAEQDPNAGSLSISMWTDGGLVTLAQSGDQPTHAFGAEWAVGPTGVVITYDDQLWIGLPSSD